MELKAEMLGKVIDRKYHIQECIGSGNFGAVFRADHKILDIFVRQVAIKITKDTDITKENAQTIFADAICLARALEESKDSEGKRFLVRVYDMGILEELEGRGYIVMEFIHSKTTLADHITSRRKFFIPKTLDKGLGKALEIAKQLCKGLRVLHSLDPPVIHRDLKPDNVLLTDNEEVRIVDFGLAAQLSKVLGFKHGVAGTTAYMAPETLMARSTCASDVYSVGLILYKMFTGEHPFENILDPPNSSEKAILQYHYEIRRKLNIKEPKDLNNTLKNNSVGERLNYIIMRCLDRTKEPRYQLASELLDALEDLGKEEEERVKLHKQAKKDMREKPITDIFIKERRLRKAEASLLEIIRKEIQKEDKESFEAYWNLGKLYIELKEIDKAIYYLQKAEDLDKRRGFLNKIHDRAELHADIAKAYRQKKIIPLAEKYEKECERLSNF